MVTALLSAVLAVGCFAAARVLTVVPGGLQITDPDVLRPLGLQVAEAALVVVLSVALGTLVRSTAGGVGLGLALVLVVPPLLAADGRRISETISDALPALRVGRGRLPRRAWPTGRPGSRWSPPGRSARGCSARSCSSAATSSASLRRVRRGGGRCRRGGRRRRGAPSCWRTWCSPSALLDDDSLDVSAASVVGAAVVVTAASAAATVGVGVVGTGAVDRGTARGVVRLGAARVTGARGWGRARPRRRLSVASAGRRRAGAPVQAGPASHWLGSVVSSAVGAASSRVLSTISVPPPPFTAAGITTRPSHAAENVTAADEQYVEGLAPARQFQPLFRPRAGCGSFPGGTSARRTVRHLCLPRFVRGVDGNLAERRRRLGESAAAAVDDHRGRPAGCHLSEQ